MGETLLFSVCSNGNKAVVKILVEDGNDINKKNKGMKQ